MINMGLFGSGKFTCWICNRKVSEEAVMLSPEQLEEAFKGVFKDLEVEENFTKENYCCCEVCGGIIKLAGSETVKAKMAVGTAASKVKGMLKKK